MELAREETIGRSSGGGYRPVRATVFSICFSSLACLAGCNLFHRTPSSTPDPLLGGPSAPTPAKTSSQPAATPVTVLPPMAAPRFSSSPAALAAGTAGSSDSPELRISSPQPASDSWAGRDPSARAAGAALRGIQSAGDSTNPPDSPAGATSVSLPSSQVTTYEQARDILASRGDIVQRPPERDPNTGLWKFSCSLPNRQDPSRHRTYVATAADSLGAVRAVLEQIERER
jgi:hypothetical protein